MDNEKKKKGGIGRIILTVVLVIVILIAAAGAFTVYEFKKASEEQQTQMNAQMSTILGQTPEDFEVQLTDGSKTTLYKLLEGKEAIVVNVFATWCGPCEAEFPEIENFYQKYGDKVEIVAISPDRSDDIDVLRKYKESHNLSFPVGRAERDPGLLNVYAYPTTYVIDRNGKIGFCQSGTFAGGDCIEKVFTAFIGNDYQEKHVALYTFYVAAKGIGGVPDAQLMLSSDNVEEILTTDNDGVAYYFTEQPGVIDVSILSLPGNYIAEEEGTVARTTGDLSQWIPIYVK